MDCSQVSLAILWLILLIFETRAVLGNCATLTVSL
jgi:hypothetical protein